MPSISAARIAMLAAAAAATVLLISVFTTWATTADHQQIPGWGGGANPRFGSMLIIACAAGALTALATAFNSPSATVRRVCLAVCALLAIPSVISVGGTLTALRSFAVSDLPVGTGSGILVALVAALALAVLAVAAVLLDVVIVE